MNGGERVDGKLFFATLLLLAQACSVAAEDCVAITDGVNSMQSSEITIEISAQDSRTFTMLIADENDERAAGFQHICPDVISGTLILFVFPSEFVPSFHMRNVHAPLDIAFIDASGVVVDVQTMNTYVLGARNQPLYSPPVPAQAALEADVGFFTSEGIEPGVSRVILP